MSPASREAKALGMKMNTAKTEVQYAGKNSVVIDVSVDGETLKQVQDFVHLGGKISSDGTSEEDVGRRICLASCGMQALSKFGSFKDIGLSTKVRVYETLLLNLLLYNSET